MRASLRWAESYHNSVNGFVTNRKATRPFAGTENAAQAAKREQKKYEGGRVLFLPPSSNECATYERFLCDKDRFSNTFSHFDRLYRPIRSDIEMTGIAAGMPDYLLHLQYAPAKCNCTQREAIWSRSPTLDTS